MARSSVPPSDTPPRSDGPSAASSTPSDQLKAHFQECKASGDYQKFCDEVARLARSETDASFALLFLTADHKILEAVGRNGDEVSGLTASQMPFYRLDWDTAPGYEQTYDGFTAWATVHVKEGTAGVLKWEDLERHPAHRGQWDSMVWKASAQHWLHSIMFAPISVLGPGEDECTCYGLLKVELSRDEAQKIPGRQASPFSPEQQRRLVELAKCVFDLLSEPQSSSFWRWFSLQSAQQKVEHLMAVLRNWRSAEYNVTEGIGYILEFFRTFIGAEQAIHVLECRDPWRGYLRRSSDTTRVYLMPYWRPSYQERRYKAGILGSIERTTIPRPSVRSQLPSGLNDSRDRLSFIQLGAQSSRRFVACLQQHGGIGALRVCKFPGTLYFVNDDNKLKLVFEEPSNAPHMRISDAVIIELRAGRNDFGLIILPIKEEDKPKPEDSPALRSYAVTLARALGRILSSEFSIQSDSSLPIHRPTGPRKLGVGFVDIRNSTSVTRILRLLGPDRLANWELFMEHYCRIMAHLANDWGRLDKFMGDGLMVLFGEEILTPGADPEHHSQLSEISVLTSACFSIAALRAFELLSQTWLGDALAAESLPWRFHKPETKSSLSDIKKEYCEDINLGLGIGLNYGAVHGDYFGDTRRRDYSVIGDNVNLCARVCHEAARLNTDLKRRMAPILVTQPVFQYLFSYLHRDARTRPALRVSLEGLGLEYPIWEIYTDDLDHGKVKKQLNDTPLGDVFEDTFIHQDGDWQLQDEFKRRLSLEGDAE